MYDNQEGDYKQDKPLDAGAELEKFGKSVAGRLLVFEQLSHAGQFRHFYQSVEARKARNTD